MDASRPLQPGFTTPCPMREKCLIRLKYEGLRNFCFRCGRLGHTRGCSYPINQHLELENLKYNDEMRTPPMSKSSTLLFHVRKTPPKPTEVFNRRHWRFNLENETGELYGFPNDRNPVNKRWMKGSAGQQMGQHALTIRIILLCLKMLFLSLIQFRRGV